MVIGTIVQTAGGNAVTGMQVVWTDKNNGWLFNPANTKKYSEAENWSPIPAADRDSRQTLQAAADAYLDLFNDKNAKVPWGTPCARLEGGAYTSKAQPGSLNPDDSCNVGVPSGVPIVDRTYVDRPRNRRGGGAVALRQGPGAGLPHLPRRARQDSNTCTPSRPAPRSPTAASSPRRRPGPGRN